MKNIFILSLIVLIIIAGISLKHLSAAKNQKKENKITFINGKKQLEDIYKKEKNNILLIDFYADWCAPCKMLSPILDEILEQRIKNVVIYKINIDDNREITSEFGIRSIPHVAFIKDGQVLQSVNGLNSKSHYLKIIEELKDSNTGGAKINRLSSEGTATLIKKNKSLLIIDVRTPAEYKNGHLINSQLIPLRELRSKIDSLKKYKNKNILVYCATGGRSFAAAQLLQENGFVKIHELQRGLKTWQKDGYKTTK